MGRRWLMLPKDTEPISDPPRILVCNSEISMRHLWMKYVFGVNLDFHCINSLLGIRSEIVKPSILGSSDEIELAEAFPPYYYICGVSVPYVWSNNFHLAFTHAPGKLLEYRSDREGAGFEWVVANAERVEVSESMIDRSHPWATESKFRTCRNWQFAHFVNSYIKESELDKEQSQRIANDSSKRFAEQREELANP